MANSKYNKYIGARYVPKIAGEWNNQINYEPLIIVTHEGASYTSKTFVPIGVDITNETYWVLTGNYNAQIEYYRQEVSEIRTSLENIIDLKGNLNFTSNKRYKLLNNINLTNQIVIENQENIIIDFNNINIDVTNINVNKAIVIKNCSNIEILNANFINNSNTNLLTCLYFENSKNCIAQNITGVGSVKSNSTYFTDYYNIFALVTFDNCKFSNVTNSYGKYCYAPFRLMNLSEKCIIEKCNAEYCIRFGMLSGSGNFPESENNYPGTKNCEVINNKCNFIDQIFLKIEPDCTGSICRDNYILNVGTPTEEDATGGIICFYQETECFNNTIISTDNNYKGFKSVGGIHAYTNGGGNNNIYCNTIKNLACSGISLGDNISFNYIERNNIDSCSKYGIKMSNFSTGNYFNFALFNKIKNCLLDAIYARYSYNSEINGNIIDSCQGFGINGEAIKNSSIINNVIKDCINQAGIRISTTAQNIIISKNKIYNCATMDTNKRVVAISDNVVNLIITDNIISSPESTFGIYIGKVSNLIFVNNNVIDNNIFVNSAATKLSNTLNYANGSEV